MVLVDTSVWIEHLRERKPRLENLLLAEQVICHPFIIGEIACGQLKNRKEIISLLEALPKSLMVEHEEILTFIENRHLMGLGLGLIDVHLLASAILSGSLLWTLDKKLYLAAGHFNLHIK